MFKRILVALKFGPASMFALKKSLELARQNEAVLHIFHALDYSMTDMDKSDPRYIGVKKEAEQRYEAEIVPLLGDLKNVTFECQPADPAMAVCKQAIQFNADLVVLGCHQQLEKMCLGRLDYVGVTILEKAPCPVMLVPLCD
jgi:nucleotide-binding universal stress UspA family protein